MPRILTMRHWLWVEQGVTYRITRLPRGQFNIHKVEGITA